MKHGMWVYPWDIADAGIDAVIPELKSLGLDCISLAAGYHAARLLLPHNPRRKVLSLEDGVVYFPADPESYGMLRPRVASEFAEREVYGDIVAGANKHGLAVWGWIVGLHNTRLGELHPQLTLVNSFGDRYVHALCPAQPATREYAVRLAVDVAERYDLEALELEAYGYMGYQHQSHHDKTGVDLDVAHHFLLSLCFCEACCRHFTNYGVDPDRIRSCTRRALEKFLNEPRTDTSNSELPGDMSAVDQAYIALTELFGDDLERLIRARSDVVTSLIKEVRQAVSRYVKIVPRVGCSRLEAAADTGADVQGLADHADMFLSAQFTGDQTTLRSRAQTLRRKIDGTRPLGIGVRAHWPDCHSQSDLRSLYGTLETIPVDAVWFYNYGLLPRKNMEWIRKLISCSPRSESR